MKWILKPRSGLRQAAYDGVACVCAYAFRSKWLEFASNCTNLETGLLDCPPLTPSNILEKAKEQPILMTGDVENDVMLPLNVCTAAGFSLVTNFSALSLSNGHRLAGSVTLNFKHGLVHATRTNLEFLQSKPASSSESCLLMCRRRLLRKFDKRTSKKTFRRPGKTPQKHLGGSTCCMWT